MLKKRLATGFLAAVLAVGVTAVPAQAVQFSDVPSYAWYASDVYDVQAYGILEGTGNGCFSPETTLTLAQAITMAARTDAYQQGKTIDSDGASPWYAPYVTYTAERGICAEGEFGTNYNEFCSRAVMAELFARVFPKNTEDNRNVVEVLPDVDNTEENAAIFYLYRQGVLTGSDAQGTFYPDAAIKRSETAAILNRVLDPDKRKTVEFEIPQTNKDLYDKAVQSFVDNYGDELALVSDELGAAFVDVNGDGVDELILGLLGDPSSVLALYTVQGGEAINLCLAPIPNKGGYWERYYLGGDGIIGNAWRNGPNLYGGAYYTIDMENRELALVEEFVIEQTADGQRTNWYSTPELAADDADNPYQEVGDPFMDTVVARYTPQPIDFAVYAFG